MTNENGLQFESDGDRAQPGFVKQSEADLPEQIDMSHDEVVRRARNEAYAECARFLEENSSLNNSSHAMAYQWAAHKIRSRISEKNVTQPESLS